jgi:excisionase family DNA binding protein
MALPDSSDILTTQQAARLLGLSTTTVQKMVANGELDAWVTSGGHRRIYRSAVEKMMPTRTDSQYSNTPGPLRVLLAEDDALQVEYFESLIKRCSHPVSLVVASDGSQALIQIERQRPDVVVTDLMMRPIDGYHLIKALANDLEYQSIAVLVVTAKTPDDARADGLLPSWVTLYQKPVQVDRLVGYLEALAGRIARIGHGASSAA